MICCKYQFPIYQIIKVGLKITEPWSTGIWPDLHIGGLQLILGYCDYLVLIQPHAYTTKKKEKGKKNLQDLVQSSCAYLNSSVIFRK